MLGPDTEIASPSRHGCAAEQPQRAGLSFRATARRSARLVALLEERSDSSEGLRELGPWAPHG